MQVSRQPPAERDMQRYFGVTPPSVHQMVLTLERLGVIRRQPGVAEASNCSSTTTAYRRCNPSNPSYPLCRGTSRRGEIISESGGAIISEQRGGFVGIWRVMRSPQTVPRLRSDLT
ncbi:helix-turn-helix domain-containing protein [Mesorhizobium sp. M0174]|uniref:helix-turn-helix domain-containing protein n=1 Tax=Mesorhizobium sp. M0174 TaxID=2956904 RepID=UPI0033385B77